MINISIFPVVTAWSPGAIVQGITHKCFGLSGSLLARFHRTWALPPGHARGGEAAAQQQERTGLRRMRHRRVAVRVLAPAPGLVGSPPVVLFSVSPGEPGLLLVVLFPTVLLVVVRLLALLVALVFVIP